MMFKQNSVIPLKAGIRYKFFYKDLINWYAKHKRDLPWRRTNDPYKIWISEIMLQQTTVATVVAFYEKWIRLFPTVHDLARAPLQAVLKQWQGLGYYNRARNLHQAARILIKEHNGVLPQDRQAISSLPGFGPYTTGSVLSIAYDMPLTIIDANVRRVVMRLLGISGEADTKKDPGINEFLLKVLPAKKAGDFNQALMELGALVCRAKGPLCLSCPVGKYCRAFKNGRQEIIPRPKKRIIKNVHAVIAVIKKRNRYFIQKRPSRGLLADLWEFPGGKIEAGETKKNALARELREELGAGLVSSKYLFDVKHFYTQFKVHLSVFSCTLSNEPKVGPARQWVSFKGLARYPMPSGSVKIIEKLASFK
ncbi:MAG: A/G-specific adenine glycosylase [Candidatus Omnitrophica bacterium]|nr:A/G-specific adenine glycosylase [Candidatus Omnitrophota bacterium]MDE2231589.1 A/G-specific adenine glycosylase [Candidatus Omnitrophota bacterium]